MKIGLFGIVSKMVNKIGEVGLLLVVQLFLSVNADFGWPTGTYGLPEPASGCPTFGEVTWKRGYTYHNTEDDYPSNKRSQNYHFAGNFSQHGIQQRFCIKDNPAGRKESWPSGRYCIYKKGPCPENLVTGYVRWDDEHRILDFPNKRIGILPDGEYKESHTTINYCCSTTGKASRAINLPNTKPFYLLAYGSPQCQKVAGTRSSMEFIKFDDNDKGGNSGFGGAHPFGPNEDLFNTKIYYCYYEPGEESTEDLGTGKKVLSKEIKHSSSGMAVAIGCGVAGAIVGTASIAFATKRILSARAKLASGFTDVDMDT